MRVCVATVCSADSFQYFIPVFIYSLKKAYPDYGIKIFLRGWLNSDVKEALKLVEGDYDIYEGSFSNYPTHVSTCNTLRHLLPANRFKNFDLLYITDIDFIFFQHKPSLGRYFQKRIEETGEPYATFKGPGRTPHRFKNGWTGIFTRIADGTLMLKIPEWFEKTYTQRKKYKNLVMKDKTDGYDHHRPCTYREYNEVMLYRMIKNSGMKTPLHRRKFIGGKDYNVLYRNIHLGDFKYNRGNSRHRMKKFMHYKNAKAFKKLQKDEAWLKLCEICERNKMVRASMKRLRYYVKKI